MRSRAPSMVILILIAGFVGFGVSAAATVDKIKFPYSPISWNSLPWWMAKDAGHFEKNGLDVDLFYEGAPSVIVQAMLAGEANFAGLAGPAVVSNVINGGGVIQIAAVVKTFTVPMFSAPNAQLKGQKVAVSRFGSISHIAAQNIFQNAGVTGATVIQSGGTPESAAMLMSGAVAAAMVPPPQNIILKEKGFRELVSVKQFRDWNIPVVENAIAARRGFIEKNPGIAKRMVRSAFEGIKTIYDNKDPGVKTLARYTKVNDEKILDESYHFCVQALSKEGMMPQEAVESLCEHYRLTLEHWLSRFEASERDIERQMDALSFRVFRLYLTGSAYEFHRGRLNIYQTLLARPERGHSGLPLTRADWYRAPDHSPEYNT